MKLKHLRDSVERLKDVDENTEVLMALDAKPIENGLEWDVSPIQSVFHSEDIEGRKMVLFLPTECSQALQKMMSEYPKGYGVEINVDKSIDLVAMELVDLKKDRK